MNQTHSKKFHCIYLLHYYPFDTQVSCQYESSTLWTFLPDWLYNNVPILDLQSGLAAEEVCPAQCGVGARHHGPAN